MRRKMVISSLAVYAIAFSCFTLLVGRTFASATAAAQTAEASPKHTDKRTNKFQFHNQTKTEEGSRTSRSPKVLQSWYQPSNLVSNSSHESNQNHSYFALFDPVLGETKKFEIPYGELPPIVSQKKLKQYRRKYRNFISRDTLRDSEMEVRVHLNGVTAKETMISSGIDGETGRRQGLKLRQLTDGKNFIQLIYNMEDEIQDCEFIRRKDLVDNFLREFGRDLERAEIAYETETEREGNSEDEKVGEEEEEEEFFEEDEGGIESYLRDEDSPYQMRNVTFEIVENERDFPREIASWMNYSALKKSCKKTQKNLKKLVNYSRNGDLKSKKLARERLERKKRDLMDVFRMPGTKWCGKGKRAAKYTSLGMFTRTDKCCRIHDTMCPYWIGGFQEKYGLFNWKLNTIMHCRCDKRFRACLKMAKTGAANLVGKLFFNIVQTQCFVLKPEEVCVKMSWWGKCEKKEYRKKAYLRDNIPY